MYGAPWLRRAVLYSEAWDPVCGRVGGAFPGLPYEDASDDGGGGGNM